MQKEIKIGWENAILKVFEDNNGITTLKNLYTVVPNLIGESSSMNFNHTIRAYLRRLKKSKNIIKQIGLSTYALTGIEYKNHFYEEIKENKIDDKYFINLPKDKIHGFIEGMLIEIGIFNEFDTYSPDKNVFFNGKRLEELITHSIIPDFTYPEILDKVRQIDVIWFKNGFPIQTFDVENSTDFTKAFLRAYQLINFRTKFFMVADEEKLSIYENRRNTKPFCFLNDDVRFLSYRNVFEEYKNAVIQNNIKKTTLIFK